jgi:hypothetical protein
MIQEMRGGCHKQGQHPKQQDYSQNFVTSNETKFPGTTVKQFSSIIAYYCQLMVMM